MQNGLNMEMNAYNVIETGDKIGYIEFNDNSDVISTVHKRFGGTFMGPFRKESLLQYVEDKWSNNNMSLTRRAYLDNFIKSTAG